MSQKDTPTTQSITDISFPTFNSTTIEKYPFVKALLRPLELSHAQARSLFLTGAINLRGRTAVYNLDHYAVIKALGNTPRYTWESPSPLTYRIPTDPITGNPVIATGTVTEIADEDKDRFTVNPEAIFDIDSQLCSKALYGFQDEDTRKSYETKCQYSARELIRTLLTGSQTVSQNLC